MWCCCIVFNGIHLRFEHVFFIHAQHFLLHLITTFLCLIYIFRIFVISLITYVSFRTIFVFVTLFYQLTFLLFPKSHLIYSQSINFILCHRQTKKDNNEWVLVPLYIKSWAIKIVREDFNCCEKTEAGILWTRQKDEIIENTMLTFQKKKNHLWS